MEELDLSLLEKIGFDEILYPDKTIPSHTQQVSNQICSYFKEKSFPCSPTARDYKTLLLIYQKEHTWIRIQISIDVVHTLLNLRFVLLPSFPQEYSIPLQEYLARINCPESDSSAAGVFYVDRSTGEIVYRYSYFYQKDSFDPAHLEEEIQSCIFSISAHYSDLQAITDGRFSNEEKMEWLVKLKIFACALRTERW